MNKMDDLFRTTETSKGDFTEKFKKECERYLDLSADEAGLLDIKEFLVYYDIETYACNTNAEKPSDLQGFMYSFAFGIWLNDEKRIAAAAVPTFSHFIKYLKEIDFPNKKVIKLVAHNSNRFDNWYVRFESRKIFQAELGNATNVKLTDTAKEKYHSRTVKSFGTGNYVLEKHIRSMNNLNIDSMRVEGFKFAVTDNFPKAGASLKKIGKMLLSSEKISKDKLKTDFGDYTQFDVEYPMSVGQRIVYSEEVFRKLDKDQMTYIFNDIHVLGHGVVFYSTIFFGFDWFKMTKTVNIKDAYLDPENEHVGMTRLQLQKEIIEVDVTKDLAYSRYHIHKRTDLFQYFNSFYFGGLNIYNDRFIGKIVKDLFSIDLNSSYPYVMYHFKVPTYPIDFFPKKYIEGKEYSMILDDLDDQDYFYFIELSFKEFNRLTALCKKRSRVLNNMFSKYFFRPNTLKKSSWSFGSVFTNSVALRLLKAFGIISENEEILVKNVVKWQTEEFGSKDKIAEFYFIKTQGKFGKKGQTVDFANSKYKINEHGQKILVSGDPTKVSIVDENFDKSKGFSDDIVQISKVNLNGLYGLPALQSTFDIGYLNEDNEIKMEKNAHQNKERNVVFSAFVTAQAFYNLLEPLKYFVDKIDDWFVYADTDSLYLKSEAREYIPKEMFNDMNLGAWDCEHEHIESMYVLNHKKYSYICWETKDEKGNDVEPYLGPIQIRSGGVANDAFNADSYGTDFERFVKERFSDGCAIKNNRSIRTKEDTIIIRETETKLSLGSKYMTEIGTAEQIEFVKQAEHLTAQKDVKLINDEYNPFAPEDFFNEEQPALYIESVFGAFSMSALNHSEPVLKNDSDNYDIDWFINHYYEMFFTDPDRVNEPDYEEERKLEVKQFLEDQKIN